MDLEDQHEPEAHSGQQAEDTDGWWFAMGNSEAFPRASLVSAFSPVAGDVHTQLPNRLDQLLQELESELAMPVLLLCHAVPHDGTQFDQFKFLGDNLAELLVLTRIMIPRGQKVALVIDSNGGDARAAYRISQFLRFWCGGWVAVVPRRAKSAATVLAFGADDIILGSFAELGPIDAQVFDEQQKRHVPALDESSSVSMMTDEAMIAVDRAMLTFQLRMPMADPDELLPHAISLASHITRPLLEKVDITRLSRRTRQLKIAQDYSERLLSNKFGSLAWSIADRFVTNYPDHNFVIDHDEAQRVMDFVAFQSKSSMVEVSSGPHGDHLPKLVTRHSPRVSDILDEMVLYVGSLLAFGSILRIQEDQDEPETTDKNESSATDQPLAPKPEENVQPDDREPSEPNGA